MHGIYLNAQLQLNYQGQFALFCLGLTAISPSFVIRNIASLNV